MEFYQLSDKQIAKIFRYREVLKLSEDEYSDEAVLGIIEHTQWLAKIYIDQFKQISPEELLKKVKLEYNISADK